MSWRMSGEMEMAGTEPGVIRASDAERRQVVAALQAACVEGRLNLDEYGQRIEDALKARTRTELDALLIDLPAHPIGGERRGAGVSTTVAVLGSAQRSGFWRLAAESRVISVLGSCKIDLRSARISAAVTRLDVASVLGSVDVIVPPGIEVELEVHAVLGSRDVRVAGAPPSAGAPVIRITGMVLLGSLSVRDAAGQAHVDAYG
jgi:hypothetical protein